MAKRQAVAKKASSTKRSQKILVSDTGERVLREIKSVAKSRRTMPEKLARVVSLLKENFDSYTWVGFYFVQDDSLALGPYSGKPTIHKKIKIGEGICGSAALHKRTIIVSDVSADPRYLACSFETRSEIVVPIISKNSVVAELDIDSDSPGAFHTEDKHFLERVSKILVPLWDKKKPKG